MDFKFQERKCNVDHDNRLASFRNRGFHDVAKDILARQIAMSDARHKLHDYVTDRINNDSSTEKFTKLRRERCEVFSLAYESPCIILDFLYNV